jgi:hypothetical protein
VSRRPRAAWAHGAVIVAAGAVVALTGVVLSRLPSTRAIRADHTLVTVTVDEVARSALAVAAAVVAVAGSAAWRRWALVATVAGPAALLAAVGDDGPVALRRAVVVRAVAVVALGVALVIGRGAARWRCGGFDTAAFVVAGLVGVAGLTALPGLRPVTATEPARALVEALTTAAGGAVTLVAAGFASSVVVSRRRPVAALAAASVALLSGAALAGDVARTVVDDLGGTGRLVVRGVAVVAAVAAATWAAVSTHPSRSGRT